MSQDSWVECEDHILQVFQSFHFSVSPFQLWDAHRTICTRCLRGKKCKRGKQLAKAYKESKSLG